MAKIEAPFTPEQVERLKQWQQGFVYREISDPEGPVKIPTPVHVFTCGGEHCNRGEREDEGVLIPTTEGWVCPCGKYKQNWCHDFMVE